MLATIAGPGLFVVVSLHYGPGGSEKLKVMGKHIPLDFSALICIIAFSLQVCVYHPEHQLRSDTGHPHRGFHLST